MVLNAEMGAEAENLTDGFVANSNLVTVQLQ
jgi:hypothetical protein